MDEEERKSFDIFDCQSDFSRDCYASMHTPPPPGPSVFCGDFLPPSTSNWTGLSSLRQSAILGEQKAQMPLLIRVRDARVLAGAVGFVSVLMLLVGLFMSGVSVGSRNSVASVNELNEYNFYTGSVAAVLAKPFEMALAFFVPVLSLVLSPRNSLQNDSVAWRTLLFCAQGTLVALLTGAFSTLNVQQLDPLVVPVIVASDLSSSSTASESTLLASDLAFSLRPTDDTLLRTAFSPVYVKATESTCQGRGGWPNIATTYAFFANDWLVDLLPDGHQASSFLNTSLSEESATSAVGSGNGATLDVSSDSAWNASLSGNLLLYAMFFSQTLLAWNGLSYLENSSLAQFQDDIALWREEGGEKNVSESDFKLAATTMLRDVLNEQSERLGLAFDTAATFFNASHMALSTDIDFDAVTIEIPFDESAIVDNGSIAASASVSGSSGNLLYSLNSIADCGESACLIPPPGQSFSATATLGDTSYTQWNAEPQIQAFTACIFEDGTEFMTANYLHGATCPRRSTTSFLVYSFARRVVADEVTVESSSNSSSRVVTVTHMQRYHTITLGRLSWQSRDLSEQFNADCGISSNCTGISFPLANGNSSLSTRHLVVGENFLPIDSLGEFDGLYSRWTPLAMLTTPSDMPGDLLFQRNVRTSPNNWLEDLDGLCSTSIDVFATQVAQNRWYMSFGLQEAYTAALFLLFQNAVVRQETQSVDGSRTLDFAGSSTHVTLEARIPLASALISLFGCVVVLVGALCIALAGRRTEGAIQRDVGVEEIAKVLLVDGRFPRLFLDCTLDDPDDSRRRPLHSFHISALVLHQEEVGSSNSAEGTGVFVRYPPLTTEGTGGGRDVFTST